MKKSSPKYFMVAGFILLIILSLINIHGSIGASSLPLASESETQAESETEKKYIKWVEFNVTCEAMQAAYDWDIATYDEEVHLNWIELLAYLGAKYGGNFDKYKGTDLKKAAEALISKETSLPQLTKKMDYYNYYLQAYGAVLGGLVGEYEITEGTQNEWVKHYGLKGFLPIAKGYPFTHYDDFGSSRSYGYKRPHLGHDMMGQVGTPIIAVESGYIEAIGWNQYGGWRIGIRSFDKKRYYYYAHLRKNFPYNTTLKEGSIVQAGDVIGYLGRTGYSSRENQNNIETPHLHWGLQLIFDESQKDGTHEIWVNCYELSRFLYQNRSETKKNPETKEHDRIDKFRDNKGSGDLSFQSLNIYLKSFSYNIIRSSSS